MPWEEFIQLLSGISADTPLGHIIAIRSERDPKVIADFTPDQRRINREWQNRMAKHVSEDDLQNALDGFLDMFKSRAGVETDG